MAKATGISGSSAVDDAEIAARAAWLHFVGGLTQQDVARRLGISSSRAHRCIARAQSLGLVRVSVDAESASCVELENTLMERHGLNLCRVAMDLMEPGPLPLRALGTIGGDWLTQIVAAGEHELIGVSHGRTLAAAVEAMGRVQTRSRFVSLLGGLTRSLSANPYDVIHRLALKTGAASYLMPAPLFTDTARDHDVLIGQSILHEVLELMRKASLAVVGIGDLATSSGVNAVASDIDEAKARLRAAGARAEILGQFLDGEGRILATEFDGRTVALPLGELKDREVVAIAGGSGKEEAIGAALRSGLITGLIIDETTARGLVEMPGGAAAAAE